MSPNRVKLFRNLPFLPTFIALAAAVFVATATTTAQADPRYKGNGPRFNSSFNTSFNTRFNYPARGVNRHFSRYNTRYNTRYNNRFDRYDNRGFNRHWNTGYRYRPARHDHWSVSLNFGSGYADSWNRTGFYTGRSGLFGATAYPYRNRTQIYYNQPTVVYVNESSRVTGRVIESRPASRPARSLLRDIHGDCFERTYDGSGRETRIQLPDSACNF